MKANPLILLGVLSVAVLVESCQSSPTPNESSQDADATRTTDPKNDQIVLLLQKAKYPLGDFEQLSKPEKVLRAINDLEMDVNNGGFNQYFINSSGDTAHYVVMALKEVGATKTAELVSRAFARFPGGSIPRETEEREKRLNDSKVEVSWDDLDQEFFKYPDDLTSLVHAYVMVHKSEIAGAAEAGF